MALFADPEQKKREQLIIALFIIGVAVQFYFYHSGVIGRVYQENIGDKDGMISNVYASVWHTNYCDLRLCFTGCSILFFDMDHRSVYCYIITPVNRGHMYCSSCIFL